METIADNKVVVPLSKEEEFKLIAMLSGRNVLRRTFRNGSGVVWTVWFPSGAVFRFPTYAGALRAAVRKEPKGAVQGLQGAGDYHDAGAGEEQAHGGAGAGAEVCDASPREEEGCP